eukprot:CAMPEP_0206539544 /NCGR_PEP_ID=MMETSP0325_2-20121206/8488_1 /ASSEMBLY_ACC=CAM_ASM_000347 /TAXON_ID=2866 /ORGANISM="Crypthecodinium cohnii, Strain Seligo" /LENGTH=681 /DNA_ID=CAMNT_0054037127 /DNA_START=459 /DNA_END=2500 /DNA_ORIENTATION=-
MKSWSRSLYWLCVLCLCCCLRIGNAAIAEAPPLLLAERAAAFKKGKGEDPLSKSVPTADLDAAAAAANKTKTAATATDRVSSSVLAPVRAPATTRATENGGVFVEEGANTLATSKQAEGSVAGGVANALATQAAANAADSAVATSAGIAASTVKNILATNANGVSSGVGSALTMNGVRVDGMGLASLATTGGDGAAEDKEPALYFEVTYNAAMQPMIDAKIGGQWLKLVFDVSSGNTIVFVKEDDACVPEGYEPCYSYEASEKAKTLKICQENNAMACSGQGQTYPCEKPFLGSLKDARNHIDALIIDGLQFDQHNVEGLDAMTLRLLGDREPKDIDWDSMAVRLLVDPMTIQNKPEQVPLKLFEGTSGILGASGTSLSCRSETLWTAFLDKENITSFSLDLAPPLEAIIQGPGDKSRIVVNELERQSLPPKVEEAIVWSQPKQTGDIVNDGMHEFLLYKLEVCGTDLLYNVSSNWLVVIDTSGPCLTLPPFLFDRVIAHAPIDCPFKPGEKAAGRLCRPRRSAPGSKLPSLFFRLEDLGMPEPAKLFIPLERLIFTETDGSELLCLSRDDSDEESAPANMMYSHIAFGSLVISSLYTVVDLENHTIGLASKGNLEREASDDACAAARTCIGSQTYYPPLNLCEDPVCSVYMLMTLDEVSKTCRWASVVPYGFGFLLFLLA